MNDPNNIWGLALIIFAAVLGFLLYMGYRLYVGFYQARGQRPLGNDDWKTRYHTLLAKTLLLGWLAVLIVLLEYNNPNRSRLNRFLLPILITLTFGFQLSSCLGIRSKAIASGQLKPNPVTNAFLRQVFFIIVPMVALAGFGLFSLRQDRLLAQQGAKESGAFLARQLVQAINDKGKRLLVDGFNALSMLQVDWQRDLSLTTTSDSGPWPGIKVWQQANPGIDLSTMPLADGWINYTPESEPSPPLPPEWFRQLTPEQKQLWQAANEALLAPTDFAAASAALEKFLATQPPPDAQDNIEYLRLLAKTRAMTDSESIVEWSKSDWRRSEQLTDAGLPVGQLICYQALRRMTSGTDIPDKLIQDLARVINYRPSVLSPFVINEAARVAQNTPSAALAATLKLWWAAEEKAQQVRAAFRAQYPTNLWSSGAFWVTNAPGDFLLTLGEGSTNANPTCSLRIYPAVVVDQVLPAAVAQTGMAVPAYAVVEWRFAGHSWTLPPGQALPATNTWSLLGEAEDKLFFGTYPLHPFQIRVWLAHPEILYARQRERTWIFGALILASVVAAGLGLLGAYRSFRRQQELSDLKSNFVSSVSHELRAPIASVRLMAENLAGGKIAGAERRQEYFRFIVQECRRLSSLIENVLDFSRIEQNRKHYEFEPTDLVALIRQTAQLMEPYAAEKGVRLALKLPPDGKVENLKAESGTAAVLELAADGRALQQALVNLMDNAIKHSPQGEIVTIGLESSPTAATVQLFVADHGPGIPASEHARIFERFYRRGSELRRETQGVGIGLSIVQHIVAAHGGRIRVDSAPGQGSCFTIELNLNNKGTKEQRGF